MATGIKISDELVKKLEIIQGNIMSGGGGRKTQLEIIEYAIDRVNFSKLFKSKKEGK